MRALRFLCSREKNTQLYWLEAQSAFLFTPQQPVKTPKARSLCFRTGLPGPRPALGQCPLWAEARSYGILAPRDLWEAHLVLRITVMKVLPSTFILRSLRHQSQPLSPQTVNLAWVSWESHGAGLPLACSPSAAGRCGGCRPAHWGECLGRVEAELKESLDPRLAHPAAFICPFMCNDMLFACTYLCTVPWIFTFLAEGPCLCDESHWLKRERTDMIQMYGNQVCVKAYNSHRV